MLAIIIMLVSGLVFSQEVNCWSAGPYDDHINFGFRPPMWKFPFGQGYDSDIYGIYKGHWRTPLRFDSREFDDDFHLMPPSEYSDYRQHVRKSEPLKAIIALPLKAYQNDPIQIEQVPQLPPPIYYESVVNYVPNSGSVAS